MELTIKDRLVFKALYPQKGNLVEQICIKDVEDKVKLSQKDIKNFGITVSPTGNVSWKKGKNIEVKFTKKELEILKAQIEKLDKEKQITPDLVDICVKIKKGK